MENLSLYEKIPQDIFPVRFLLFDTKTTVPFRLHWHEHLEIHYVLKGESNVRCGDSFVRLSAGDTLVINSAELHEWIDGHYQYVCIILPPSFTENREVLFQNLIRDEEMGQMIGRMLKVYEEDSPVKDMVLKGNAYLLLAALYEKYTVRIIKNTKEYFSHKTALNRAIQYLHEHYTQDISLDEIADMLYVSKYHFCHLFKNETGKTLKEYINTLRVNKASDLIATTDMSMTQIADLCGFNDSNYYSRVFRQVKGQSPTEFRNSIKENRLSI